MEARAVATHWRGWLGWVGRLHKDGGPAQVRAREKNVLERRQREESSSRSLRTAVGEGRGEAGLEGEGPINLEW